MQVAVGIWSFAAGGEPFRGDEALTRDEAARERNWELCISLDGHIAGKGIREIAEYLHRAERVAVDWGADSGLRARTRRLVGKARRRAGGERATPRGNSP